MGDESRRVLMSTTLEPHERKAGREVVSRRTTRVLLQRTGKWMLGR